MWMVYEIRSLSLRSRRILALALLGLAVTGVTLLFVKPLIERQAAHWQAVDAKLQVLERYAAIARYGAEQPATSASDVIETHPPIQYPVQDEALLLADLQGRVAEGAAREGVTLHSTQAVAAQERDGLGWIGVEAALMGPLSGVQRMLASLEQGAPRLFVRTAELRADQSGGYDPSLGIVVSVSLKIEASVQRKASP